MSKNAKINDALRQIDEHNESEGGNTYNRVNQLLKEINLSIKAIEGVSIHIEFISVGLIRLGELLQSLMEIEWAIIPPAILTIRNEVSEDLKNRLSIIDKSEHQHLS